MLQLVTYIFNEVYTATFRHPAFTEQIKVINIPMLPPPATPTPIPTPTATPIMTPTIAPVNPTPASTMPSTVSDSTGNYNIGSDGATFSEPTGSDATVSLPATITVNGQPIKVTAIADNVFKGNKKLTMITSVHRLRTGIG